MKKGFTLTELLAILAIISIVALITMPIIVDTIEENRKHTVLINTEKVVKLFENYKTTYELETGKELKNVSYKIVNSKLVNLDLDIKGNLPANGEVSINSDGEIKVYAYDKGYCAVKGDLEQNVRISKRDEANCNYEANNSLVNGSQAIIEDGLPGSIKSVTIYGNSVQETSTHGTNYAPEVSTWILSNGAYIDSQGWLVLPNADSYAYVDIKWDKVSASLYLKGTAYATIDDSYVHFTTTYLDASKASISGNGYANKITLNTNYSFSTYFGGNNTYGEALAQAVYVRLQVRRSTAYAKNEYKIRDIYAGPTSVAYTPFTPNMPSPDYPSEIYSVGTYNATTNKYDVNIEINHGNLIKNGFGELNNNTNFTSFTFKNENSDSAPRKSFTITSPLYQSLKSIDFAEIDITKDYEISMWAKNNGINTRYHTGFTSFDIAKNEIAPRYNMYIPNTLTTLAQELKNGDTTVYLASNQNFKTASNTPTYQLGLIFWNYKDSTGYTFPENTYSRNIWADLYTYGNINKTNNTLILKAAWNKGTIPAGTKVSQSADGGTYNYSLRSNTKFSDEWLYYKQIISGVEYTGQNSYVKFRPGTKYVKFLTLDNVDKVYNSSTYYSGIKFIEKEKKEITYSLNEPLRSLPDGTKDKLVIDNANKRAYVERNIGYKEFDGSENWIQYSSTYTNLFYYQPLLKGGVDGARFPSFCSHYVWNNGALDRKYDEQRLMSTSGISGRVYISSSTYSDVNSFKIFLSTQKTNNTPVAIQYKLATPGIEELDYQEIQNYDGRSDIILNNLTQPSSIETVYLNN